MQTSYVQENRRRNGKKLGYIYEHVSYLPMEWNEMSEKYFLYKYI